MTNLQTYPFVGVNRLDELFDSLAELLPLRDEPTQEALLDLVESLDVDQFTRDCYRGRVRSSWALETCRDCAAAPARRVMRGLCDTCRFDPGPPPFDTREEDRGER